MKNILITGASRGIGFETALRLSENNNVIAVSRSQAGLDALKKASDSRISTIPLDLSADDYSPIENALSGLDQLDILINNAGLLKFAHFEDLTLEDWKAMFDVNVFALVRLTQVCLKHLKNAANAHIVNIGSVGGITGSDKFPGLAAYSASKGAVSILTEVLAKEFTSISVNCLCLGAVNTEMLKQAFPGYKAPINSNEMAEFISDFALNGNRFFNGQNIPVTMSNPG